MLIIHTSTKDIVDPIIIMLPYFLKYLTRNLPIKVRISTITHPIKH